MVGLGSGIDTRAYRLPFSRPLQYFEIDLAPVILFKQSVFFPSSASGDGNLIPPSSTHLSLLAADLTHPSWKDQLKSIGFNNDLPTLWVLEGLVMYLDAGSVSNLLHDISSLSEHGSHIMLHTVNTQEIAIAAENSSEDTQSSPTDILSSLSSKMTFGIDEPGNLLSGGWQDVESYDYLRVAQNLGSEKYLLDLKTNSVFTTAKYVKQTK